LLLLGRPGIALPLAASDGDAERDRMRRAGAIVPPRNILVAGKLVVFSFLLSVGGLVIGADNPALHPNGILVICVTFLNRNLPAQRRIGGEGFVGAAGGSAWVGARTE